MQFLHLPQKQTRPILSLQSLDCNRRNIAEHTLLQINIERVSIQLSIMAGKRKCQICHRLYWLGKRRVVKKEC